MKAIADKKSSGLSWIRADNYEAMSDFGAERIYATIERGIRKKKPVLVGLATGNTMLSLYAKLSDMLNRSGLNLAQLHTFNLDEYVGRDGRSVPLDHPLSYRSYMEKNFFSRLGPKLEMSPAHIHMPDPQNPAAYDALIERLGGLDIQLLGIGFNGHIAFNEPIPEVEISVEAYGALPSRVIDLKQLTIDTNARLTANGDYSKVPRQAVTMGMAPILASKEIVLLACFPEQHYPLSRIKKGRITPEIPGSYLLGHLDSVIIYAADLVSVEEGR